MQLVATLEILSFYLIAFGVRSFVQWWRTGKTGFVGVGKDSTPLTRTAALLMLFALLLAPIAPWVGASIGSHLQTPGIVMALFGIGATLLAQMQMGASWRIGVNNSEQTKLVTTGVFRAVRNPIFSAMLLASLGVALTVPTPLALVVPPTLLAALELQVRFVEEPYLIRTHGQQYFDWAAQTGRFVPWLGRLRASEGQTPRATSSGAAAGS